MSVQAENMSNKGSSQLCAGAVSSRDVIFRNISDVKKFAYQINVATAKRCEFHRLTCLCDGGSVQLNDVNFEADFYFKVLFEKGYALAWSSSHYIEAGKPPGSTLCCDVEAIKRISPNKDTIATIYCELRNPRKSGYAKILVVGFNYFEELLENIDRLFVRSPRDQNAPYDLSEYLAETEQRVGRIKSQTETWRRIATFRKRVLGKYRGKCAICRCDVVEIIEAAHKRGFEVARGDYFEPEHGVALCRNHHRMYDAGLIDIDFEVGTVAINDSRVATMSWVQTFFNEYAGRIIEPAQHVSSVNAV